MAQIPKYVYEDLKMQVKDKMNESMKDVLDNLKKEESEEQSILNKEWIEKILPTLDKKEASIYSDWNSSYIKFPISQNDKNEYNKKEKSITEKYKKVRRKLLEDLQSQVNEWMMGIYSKASDDTKLELPTFKIDETKYKVE